MGKAMSKDTVIFGGDKNHKLAGFSSWPDAKKAVVDRIGPKQTPMWSQAEVALKTWAKEPAMADAYVKIGVIDGNLVLRAKSKHFLGDDERDAVLLKGYKLAVDAWAKAQSENVAEHKTGREIIAMELKGIKSRAEGYKLLKSMGVNDSQLGMLVSDNAVTKLLVAVRVPAEDIGGLVRGKLLLNEPMIIIDAIGRTDDAKLLVKLVQKLGLPASAINALAHGASAETVEDMLKDLGVPAKRAEAVSMILLDAETPQEKTNRKLRDMAGLDDIVKRLGKLGIKEATVRDWATGSGYSEDSIVDVIVAKGVDKAVAKKLAALLLP